MPQVTVYVRSEDLESWKNIEKKSEWLHNQLAGAGTSSPTLPQYGMRAPVRSTNVPIEKIISALGGKTVQEPDAKEQALLDSLPVVPGCCLLKTPCKHWLWSGEQMAYVNTISGEIRSVDV